MKLFQILVIVTLLCSACLAYTKSKGQSLEYGERLGSPTYSSTRQSKQKLVPKQTVPASSSYVTYSDQDEDSYHQPEASRNRLNQKAYSQESSSGLAYSKAAASPSYRSSGSEDSHRYGSDIGSLKKHQTVLKSSSSAYGPTVHHGRNQGSHHRSQHGSHHGGYQRQNRGYEQYQQQEYHYQQPIHHQSHGHGGSGGYQQQSYPHYPQNYGFGYITNQVDKHGARAEVRRDQTNRRSSYAVRQTHPYGGSSAVYFHLGTNH